MLRKRRTENGGCQISRWFAYFLISLGVLGALSVSNALAQESTASVNGTIQDSTGGVIPGATVILTNTKTSVKQTTVSTDTGRYVFVNYH